MVSFLMFFVALLLLVVSYCLLFKQQLFFSLLPRNKSNQDFFRLYGILHGILGILALALAFVDEKMVLLLYLAFMLIISASFSLIFAKKMTKPKS